MTNSCASHLRSNAIPGQPVRERLGPNIFFGRSYKNVGTIGVVVSITIVFSTALALNGHFGNAECPPGLLRLNFLDFESCSVKE